jgi:N-acetyl sugar amidotransferase
MERYRICERCVMDTTDPEICFDENGVCNNCQRALYLMQSRLPLYKTGPYKLERVVQEIQREGRNKPFDCVIGVSGGVDSTYVAHLSKKIGLRPLAVHFDNGWNSELAVSNIEKSLRALGIELSTFVMNWEEFRDLQLSFLKASVPDIEVPTDHAIAAVLFQTALKHNIRYVLTGTNLVTECVLPRRWAYGFCDWKYIRSIHRMFGTASLRGYPHFSLGEYAYYFTVRGLKTISILNSVDYNKADARTVLERDLAWRDYGGKHHESIITRFLQTYILPRKFDIDKRRAHLSALIVSGQITRQEALMKLAEPSYDERLLAEDLLYVSKKFGLTEKAFDRIMRQPPKCFLDYPSHFYNIERLKRLKGWAQKSGLLPAQVGM